ncbi:MAG TPA: hypothetical protein PKD55_12430 [Bellilinea sp.]|nr:hypothetical protein [Bellilinea sp.]
MSARIALILQILVLASCGTQAPSPEPTPVPELSVSIPQSLAWTEPVALNCAASVNLILTTNPNNTTSELVLLSLQTEKSNDTGLYQLLTGNIIAVTSKQTTVTVSNIDELNAALKDPGDIYKIAIPPGSFAAALEQKLGIKLSGDSLLIPDETAMIFFLEANPNGIGFLPDFMVATNLTPLLINSAPLPVLPIALVAETRNQPSPKVQNWLVCMQKSLER